MDGWEKLKIGVSAVSAVVIPVVLLIIGNDYSAAIKDRELEGRFVELAVAILREEPTPDNKSLRGWATQVINRYSGVELPKDAQNQLIESLRLTANPGVVVPRTRSNAGLTDFDVFVCEAAWDDPAAQQSAESVVSLLRDRSGQIALKRWGGTLYREVPLDALRGKLTLVVDRNHPEQGDVARLEGLLSGDPALPPLQVLDNTGSETPWLISLIVCP